jgi:hypothetical protein
MSSVDASTGLLRARLKVVELWRTADRRAWREAGVLLVITRASFLAVAHAAGWFLASGRGPLERGWVDVWSRWDALHFYALATYGYSGPGVDPHATAFFPGFPLALRAGMWMGLSPVVSGLLISAAASLVAFAWLFKLAERDGGPGTGRKAVTYLALWPTAVFLVAPYSEALFLAGAIPAFHLARRRRWARAGLPAALAVATRAAGVFLLFGLALEFLRQRDFSGARLRSAALGLLVGVLPLVAYAGWLGATEGSPLQFVTDQRLGWGRELTNPVRALANTWNTWNGADYPSNWIFAWRVEVAAAAAGVGFCAWALYKREWGYAGYIGVTMAALLASTWYFSIPRMLLSLFPAMVFLAEWSRARPLRHDALVAALAPAATLGVIVFTSGAWFY